MRTMTLLLVVAVVGLWAADDISHADLKAAIDAKQVTLLDVNGSESYAKHHIPGALDFAVIKDDLASHLPADKDALIVAYCGGPKCGAWKRAATAATALGYTNVKHYSAGISGWQQQAKASEAGKDKVSKLGDACTIGGCAVGGKATVAKDGAACAIGAEATVAKAGAVCEPGVDCDPASCPVKVAEAAAAKDATTANP